MKRWSIFNIKLLIQGQCHYVLQKVLYILDGLCAYWEDILIPINWPNTIRNQSHILLVKIYFATDFITDCNLITEFFELPSDKILYIATKIITKKERKYIITSIIDSIDLQLLNEPDPKDITLITETLHSWNSILKATTINLWRFNLQKAQQSEASKKLKAKMDSEKITSATIATSKALLKALDNIKNRNDTNQVTELRIINLEKQVFHQKQTASEIINHLK